MTGAELERLLAEAVPDGSFGGPKPPPVPAPVPPDPDAEAHCRELLAALAERRRRPVARGDPALTDTCRPVGR